MMLRQSVLRSAAAAATSLGAWKSAPCGDRAPTLCEPPREIPSAFDTDWDRRHPYDDSVKCQGRTKVMLLIRHGQYESNGGPNFGLLTDKGREQASMAGKHLVARMRASPPLKKGMLRLTSSAMERAIETADIIQREVEAELAWVDISGKDLREDIHVQFVRFMDDDDAELVVTRGAVQTLKDDENLLQPCVDVGEGSRVRVNRSAIPLWSIEFPARSLGQLSIYSPLRPVSKPPSRFEDWECAGCDRRIERGDVHWSDAAETNRLGFCDACYGEGPKHRKLAAGDACSRVTHGLVVNPFRMPNDPNLNEACPEPLSGVKPGEALFDDFAELTSQTLREGAAVKAAFAAHMCRTVDHKRLPRCDRSDVARLVFVTDDGKQHIRWWTAKEFGKLCFDWVGQLGFILDENAKERIEGNFHLITVGSQDVATNATLKDARDMVAEAIRAGAPPRRRQYEIIVAHQNVIRYFFLKAMQFDTARWLDFGGSNCSMTQIRIAPAGICVCDFFGAHPSTMPVDYYTFNKHSDV